MRRGGNPKVAVTVGPAGHGGISTYSRELAVALCRRHDLDVVVVGSPAALAEIEAIRGEALPDRITLRGPRALEQVRVASLSLCLRRRAVDVVHATRHVVPFGWSGAVVLTFHDQFVLTRRDDYGVAKRLLLAPIFRRSVRRADVLVALTSVVAESAVALGTRGSVLVETGAAAPTRLVAAAPIAPSGFPTGRRFALVVGDAGPRKRVDRLVDVWRQLETEVVLVVAGGRSAAPDLVAQVAESDRVLLVAEPTDGQLAWLYLHADLVVDASEEEGFGFPRVEAAAFGVPYAAVREAQVADADSSWVAFLRERIRESARQFDGHQPSSAALEPQVSAWDEVAERTMAAYRAALERSRPSRVRRRWWHPVPPVDRAARVDEASV